MMEPMPSNAGTTWRSVGAFGVDDIYKHYKSQNNPKAVNEKTFRAVLRECNKLFMEMVILRGMEMAIPFVGKLLVTKRHFTDQVHLTMDYGLFNKTGEKKMFTNDHSDGYRAKVRWRRHKIGVSGIKMFEFLPCRAAKNMVAAEMKKPNGHAKYVEPKFKSR